MDIKSQLKEAREAIKIKDFKTSIQICKNILSEDKDNYLALVFLALSIQETKLSEECEIIFRRAIEVNPDNLLAWNGLANYFEKLDTTEARLELIKLYTFLIGKETTEKKVTEYCEKLCNLYKYTNVEDICRVIYEKVENSNFSETTLLNSRSSLANILKQSNDLSDDILDVYEDILSSLINNDETATVDYYSQYLMVLYKQKKVESVVEHLMKMHKKFPDDVTSMNWICKLYDELYIEDKVFLTAEFPNMKKIFERLLDLDPENSMGMFTKAVYYFGEMNYPESKKILDEVVSKRPGLVHAWILLTRVNIILHLHNDASESAGLTLRLMKSPKCSFDDSLKIQVVTMYLEALSRSAASSDWEKAIAHYEKLEGKCKQLCLPHFTRANIKLGNTMEAKTSITSLAKIPHRDENMTTILYAQLLRKEMKHEEALSLLEDKENCSPEWFLELGITYLEMKQLNKSMLPFLKAAKSDPNNHYCFYYLGLCYRELQEYDKARRCYEKSYKLCPSFVEAALELSKIYRIQKKWDINIDLLQSITKDSINKQNMWAWLQMGLNLMEQGDYEKAIEHLRLVSRVDSHNLHCWEALGDAYLSRGAYRSAQRAYERVLEISPDVLYPALQIALIKKDLGQLQEAIYDFEMLLTQNKNCMLTLAGLAETYLKNAKEYLLEQRIGTARDYAQHSVEVLTRAIRQCSEFTCLWKLLGDCCMLIGELPENYCCLMIMRALDEGLDVKGDKILENEDLFQLAAKCYCKATILSEDNHLIWHDLALCYLLQAKKSENRNTRDDFLTRAQAVIEHCTMQDPRHWPHWNLMGNIALARDPPNFALAQHAFIKALFLDHNCSIAWTNLGILYLRNHNIKLANQAFGEAQRSDPNYPQGWIGQGLLAEILEQEEEAMALFRQSISLGFHSQAALGYGHLVCCKLIESPKNINLYAIKELNAVSLACDALMWFTARNSRDPCAWNMLGILQERMGLKFGATESFKKAVAFSTAKNCDPARINFGRALTKLGLYKKAVKVCGDVQESSFNSGIWYALALYKEKRLKDSSSIYLAIAQYLAKDKRSIGEVIACMAIIAYILGEPEHAKTTITESLEQTLPTAKAMYALIGLGIVQKDPSLVSLTLKQLEVLKDVPESIEDFVMLMTYVHIFQGNYTKAIRKASKLVHLLPFNSSLWLIFSLTLLHSLKYVKSKSLVVTAHSAARNALLLRNDEASHQDVAKILCTISASSMLLQDRKTALISAQKAVHLMPQAKECWMVLNDSLEWFLDKKHVLESTSQVLCSTRTEFEYIRINSIF